MNASGNAKYTSKNIQSDIPDCLAEMVCGGIIKEVKKGLHVTQLMKQRILAKKNTCPLC